jgi:hypothetical protein
MASHCQAQLFGIHTREEGTLSYCWRSATKEQIAKANRQVLQRVVILPETSAVLQECVADAGLAGSRPCAGSSQSPPDGLKPLHANSFI